MIQSAVEQFYKLRSQFLLNLEKQKCLLKESDGDGKDKEICYFSNG